MLRRARVMSQGDGCSVCILSVHDFAWQYSVRKCVEMVGISGSREETARIADVADECARFVEDSGGCDSKGRWQQGRMGPTIRARRKARH